MTYIQSGRQQTLHTGARGLTLIELMVAVAILGVTASIASVAYHGYIDTANVNRARKQIIVMSLAIKEYYEQYHHYPASLAAVDLATVKDPWGYPYHYLNIATADTGAVRKDHNLVPLNTDFDLYSFGKDGKSTPPLTAAASRDDVVRANNGDYVGLASNY